jgi:redox-sensitive bicupin YhaK (pirin superfamily)
MLRLCCWEGEPFPEKRTVWWNFVSTDKERIEQAKIDWAEGRFDPVINETEFIPLPKDK